jgi:hypothetical protein
MLLAFGPTVNRLQLLANKKPDAAFAASGYGVGNMSIVPNVSSRLHLPEAAVGKSFTALGGRRYNPLQTLPPEPRQIGRKSTGVFGAMPISGCGAEPAADSTGSLSKWVRF